MEERECELWSCCGQLDIFAVVLWSKWGPFYICFDCMRRHSKYSWIRSPLENMLYEWETNQMRKAELREIEDNENALKSKFWLKYT